ncbi:hypothetical protein M426DRAFT_15965 [Hypoxylon sp. CI-4A]|nr:hypothetical protein M426DRAFT_15965 [Hypoxylon sp. CI-4A]
MHYAKLLLAIVASNVMAIALPVNILQLGAGSKRTIETAGSLETDDDDAIAYKWNDGN